MTFVAFLDANVLVPARLRDVLLTVAEAGSFSPRWSRAVLEEMKRHLPESMTGEHVEALVVALESAFPEALVLAGEVTLTPPDTINSKDLHVVAAALTCRADVLVTQDMQLINEVRTCLPQAIGVQPPDLFLAYAVDVNPRLVRANLLDMMQRRWVPEHRPETELWDRFHHWCEHEGLEATAHELRRIRHSGERS